MDYDTDFHFLFPEKILLDSDRSSSNYVILDKTSRDSFFSRANSEDEHYEYGDAKWK